mgnify:CR=1 FL=1
MDVRTYLLLYDFHRNSIVEDSDSEGIHKCIHVMEGFVANDHGGSGSLLPKHSIHWDHQEWRPAPVLFPLGADGFPNGFMRDNFLNSWKRHDYLVALWTLLGKTLVALNFQSTIGGNSSGPKIDPG